MRAIEFQIPRVRERNALVMTSTDGTAPMVRPPRLARQLALAHKLDGLVRSGAIRGYGELAQLGGISQSRMFQILILVNLSPAIQERVLFITAAEAQFLYERDLRVVARESNWSRQAERFDNLGLKQI